MHNNMACRLLSVSLMQVVLGTLLFLMVYNIGGKEMVSQLVYDWVELE